MTGGLGRDWCPTCESGQDIEDIHREVEVQTLDGKGPEYVEIDLACGHSLAVPTGRFA